ncbi:hypothetical protein FQZ97_842830 [compost metagenome]
MLIALERFLVTLLLEQEAAIVVQQPGIVAALGNGLEKVLVGQLRLHLDLEHQGQGGMRVGAGRVQFQGFFQRHLGTLAGTLLQVANAQLDIGITRLITPLTGSHRVNITGRNATGQQAGD